MNKLLSALIAAGFAAASLTAFAADADADAHKAGATRSAETGKGKSTVRNVTVPKQTQGATFGEKVNAGLHAAGGMISQGREPDTSEGSAAVSSVGNLAGGGGGAAAASYAATGKAAAPTTTADAAPNVAGKNVEAKKTRAKHDTAKNSVGNIR